jgi:prepilin-type N-terminal cleavage/methylation domain-containing protein
MMEKRNLKRGFTIAEMLIAISIFVVIATISTSILIRTVNMEKLTDIRNTMLDDARVFMEQMTSLINSGAIDYEEYYNIYVVQGKETDPTKIAYGVNYGAYGSRFYSAGDAAFRGGEMVVPTINPDHLGVDCADPVDAAPQNCNVTYTDSKDKNEGQNPWDGGTLTDANAFCDENLTNSVTCGGIGDSVSSPELYVISDAMNDEGKIQKYIIATQPLNGTIPNPDIDPNADRIAVASIMNGLDVDGNNVADLFRCEDEGAPCHDDTDTAWAGTPVEDFYSNYGDDFELLIPTIDPADTNSYKYSLPFKSDHTGNFAATQQSFFPLTPFRTSIKSLQFIISPVEDPYKAYNEPNMKMHPTVTILLTVRPSETDRERYPGGWDDKYDVKIQRTVTAGVKEIDSFAPTYDLTWICDLLGDGSGCADYDYSIVP